MDLKNGPETQMTSGFLERFLTHPEEGVQSSVLHEFGYYQHWAAPGQHPLQMDDVGVVELAHDACLGQEVAPLMLGVARFQSFDGHGCFLPARLLQPPATNLSKLP